MGTSFLSLPMGAGPLSRDTGATDELGNTVYRDAFGNPYTIKTQNPNRESYVRAGLGALDKARKAPLESLTAAAQAIAQGAWDAVATPRRSWSDTVTYGDVANTAGLVSLPAVAGKYDPAVANMGLRYTRPEGDDFRGWHKAPGRGADNGTFDNLSSIYPDDVYDRRVAAQYYGHGGEPWERSTIDSFAAARGNPDAEVMVYRAVPEGIDDIFAGDWVTPNRAYAEMHGNSWVDDGKYKILAEKVRAGDLYTDANSIHEFGWDPSPRIRAYHGSPHDFDRFDMSKIGTGEGAQAYGHGLYFAEAEDVARQYRDQLQRPMVDGKSILTGDFSSAAQEAIWQAAENYGAKSTDDVADFLQGRLDELGDLLPYSSARTYRNTIAELRDAGNKPINMGKMYEVDINADPADFLDWDAPLSEQPENVRRIAENTLAGKRPIQWQFNGYTGSYVQKTPDAGGSKHLGRVTNTAPGKYTVKIGKDEIGVAGDVDSAKALLDKELVKRGKIPERAFSPKGSDVYAELSGGIDSLSFDTPNRVGATDTMREAGIPGIKYYDQGSRASGQGTRNYVVFDDSLIEILRKYGLAGLAPLGATLAGSDQAQY